MVLPWQRRIERSSIEESNDFGIRVMTVQYKIMTSSHRPRGFAPSRVGLLLDIVCHLSAVAVQYIGSLFNLDMHLQSLKVPNQKHVCNHQLFDWGLWRLLSHETSCIKHFDQAGLTLIRTTRNIWICCLFLCERGSKLFAVYDQCYILWLPSAIVCQGAVTSCLNSPLFSFTRLSQTKTLVRSLIEDSL